MRAVKRLSDRLAVSTELRSESGKCRKPPSVSIPESVDGKAPQEIPQEGICQQIN